MSDTTEPRTVADTTEQWRHFNRIRMAVDPDDMTKAHRIRAEYIEIYGKRRPQALPPCAEDDCDDTCPIPEGYRGTPYLCQQHADELNALLFGDLQ